MAPSPVWKDLTRENVSAIRQPEIFQFSSDSFMEDFISQLETDPDQVGKYSVRAETWRGPASQLKLYQPAHQRHYIVSASLVCRNPGLPDRTVDKGKEETVSFVLRRLLPSSDDSSNGRQEYALIPGSDGYAWFRVKANGRASEDVLVPGEEVLPMFPLSYEGESHARRVFAGTIPVGKHEIYENSATDSSQDKNSGNGIAGSEAPKKMARKIRCLVDVIEPWNNLLESASTMNQMASASQFSDAPDGLDVPTGNERTNLIKSQLKTSREQIQTGSWYILLDFADYLAEYLENVWTAIETGNDSGLTTEEDELLTVLEAIEPDSGVATGVRSMKQNMREALRDIVDFRSQLDEEKPPSYDSEDYSYEDSWPDFLFPLADPAYGNGHVLERNSQPFSPDALTSLITDALPEESNKPDPAVPLAAKLSGQETPETGAGLYRIRCVFQRPECEPWQENVVSEPTESFQLAGFFDPDAPARPIQVTLPADPTPSGLRKYAKNTAFRMSNDMCNKLGSVKKVTLGDLVRSVLPWPFHKDLPIGGGGDECKDDSGNPIGVVCSLSIPIVTICAMFLLFIIAFVLDILFRWIPWLFTCFPLPNFGGEE